MIKERTTAGQRVYDERLTAATPLIVQTKLVSLFSPTMRQAATTGLCATGARLAKNGHGETAFEAWSAATAHVIARSNNDVRHAMSARERNSAWAKPQTLVSGRPLVTKCRLFEAADR